VNQCDYSYIFSEISKRHHRGSVQRINHETNRPEFLSISVNDDDLLSRRLATMPAIVADLIDVASAVHVADRLTPRREDATYHIALTLPVRCPDIWGDVMVLDHLRKVLLWFTGDHWTFDFRRYGSLRRASEHAVRLPFDVEADLPGEVALWSGGLDSLAGLCSRLSSERDSLTRYTLLSTGSSLYMDGVQKKVAADLKKLAKHDADRLMFVRVPIRLTDSGHLAKNACMRSRGFTFLFMGAACAVLEGQSLLHIYENGVGAINLPYRLSEVDYDHSRAVHPLSLLAMSNLVSCVLDRHFAFSNPFLFQTKAAMCQSLTDPHLTSLIAKTVSCDSRHRAAEIQCGYCSSCLLRRQALAVAHIADGGAYLINNTMAQRVPRDGDVHLRAMRHQIDTLHGALEGPDRWDGLCTRFVDLVDIADRTAMAYGLTPMMMQAELVRLYGAYVREWDALQAVTVTEQWLQTTGRMPQAA